MKKHYLAIIAILLCTTYGVLSWDIVTHSQNTTPADSKYAASCGAENGSTENLDMCCLNYHEALESVRIDWQENLRDLTDQEKPASEMVEEGYESLRTYNCWSEYICRAVLYSGHAPVQSGLSTGLTSEHLGIVPGCQKPEDLRMDTQYNTLMESLLGNAFVNNKMNYFPGCQTDSRNNQNPNLALAQERYNACKQVMELNFGCPEGTDQSQCSQYSSAFTDLETALQKRHGEQKATALESKLSTIIPKMNNMEEHVNYLAKFLQQLDSRFVCYANKCQ